jgi:protein gp37
MPRKCIQFAISELDCKETMLMQMCNVNGRTWPAPNIWLGTSVENQEAANERIPHLLKCPAAVRFLSCEPLIGPVDFYKASDVWWEDGYQPWKNQPALTGIDWVIAGGESGPGARPMHPDWLRLLRDQCTTVDTAFFFKQWGKWVSEFHPAASPSDMETSNKFVTYVDMDHNDVETQEEAVDYYGQYMVNVGKKKAGRELDGREWNQFPEVNYED